MAEYVLHQYLKPNKRTVEDEYDEISWHLTFSYSHVKKIKNGYRCKSTLMGIGLRRKVRIPRTLTNGGIESKGAWAAAADSSRCSISLATLRATAVGRLRLLTPVSSECAQPNGEMR